MTKEGGEGGEEGGEGAEEFCVRERESGLASLGERETNRCIRELLRRRRETAGCESCRRG